MDQTQLTLYKAPFLDELTKDEKTSYKKGNLTIIGVIDASGSMQGCWSWLANFWNQSIPKEDLIAITFSNYPTVLTNDKNLKPDINSHGGGGTEIVPAFVEFEKQLAKVPVENNVTVIFISDGCDNQVRTLDSRMKASLKGNLLNHRINFICLGIQKNFPTNLSMNLRELYHRGDPQIPAIYLIEYASEQAFFNKFETMKSYFYPARVLQLNKYANLYPYDEQITKEVFEGQWFISYEGNISITNEGKNLPLDGIKEDQIEIDDVIDVFRSWVQNLQLKIIQQKQHLPYQCENCLEIMKRIVGHLNVKLGFDILALSNEDFLDTNKPFHIRVKEGFVYKYCTKILYFVQEVESLMKGVNPGQLSEFEQAKRLMIGTITGKHLQKALALKGITLDEFQIIKKEFIEIMKNCKFQKQNDQGQERSVITLENQRDILTDLVLLEESMKFVKSQYDFAETFPLIGHGIKVKRIEGSQVNPWLVNVLQFAQQNKVIDSGYLIKNNFAVQLNVGGQDKEEINCILPLYNESDQDLQPFLRSRIIKLLMTFMVQQNVDTLYEESYLALLANALVYILQQKESQWRFEILEMIYNTTKIVYSGTQQFEDFLQKLINSTPQAFLDKDQQYEQFTAPAKILIYLFYAFRSGLITNVSDYIDKLIVYCFYRNYLRTPNLQQTGFKSQLDAESEQALKQKLQQYFIKCLYLLDFRRTLQTDFLKVMKEQFSQFKKTVKVNEDLLYNEEMKFNFKCVEGLYQLFLKKPFDVSQYKYHLNHVFVAKENVFTKPINFEDDESINSIASQTEQLSKYDYIRDQLEVEYIKNYQETHLIIPPLTYNELKEECVKINVNVNDIIFNQEVGIAKNCCMAKQCPFYLQPMATEKFRKHLHNWQDLYPRGFHGFALERVKQGLKNEDFMVQAKQRWNGFPEKFKGTEEQVFQYVDIIRQYHVKKQ